MYNFGKSPPRSLRSFGVSGLLAEQSKVYYDNLFSSRSIGRVCDVLSSQLREQGLDEVRLRAVLLFSFFDALGAASRPLSEPLTIECGLDSEKVAVGISFLLSPEMEIVAEGLPARVFGLEAAPRDSFEALLAEVATHADHLVIRMEPGTRRIELVSLLGIPGQLEIPGKQPPTWISLDSPQESGARPEAEYIQIGDLDYTPLLTERAPDGMTAPGPSEGELLARFAGDRAAARKTAVKGKHGAGDSEEEIRISGAKDREEDEIHRFKGGGATEPARALRTKAGALAADDKSQAAGPDAQDSADDASSSGEHSAAVQARKARKAAGELTLSLDQDGGTPDGPETVLRGAASGSTDEEVVISLGAKARKKSGLPDGDDPELEEEALDDSGPSRVDRVKKIRKAKKGPQGEIIEEDEDVEDGDEAGSADGSEQEPDAPSSPLRRFVERILPFTRRKKARKADEIGDEENDADIADESESPRKSKPKSRKKKGAEDPDEDSAAELDPAADSGPAPTPIDQLVKATRTPDTDDAELATRKIVQDLEAGDLTTVVRKGQAYVDQMKKDPAAAANRGQWMEGFMERLVEEQQKLTDAARKALAAAKKSQLEFRRKEQTLIQEARRRDELLNQKNTVLMRTREQLDRVNAQLQKAKESSAQSGEDTNGLKQKFQAAQRQLSASKEENAKLAVKLEEMKAQVANLQLAQKSAGGAATGEANTLKQKMERLTRQYNQMKALNDQLMKKSLQNATRPGPEKPKAAKPNNDEIKKKLDSANKTLVAQQKELEQLRLKIDEAGRDEIRLKGDLARSQTELKAARVEIQRLRSRKPTPAPAGAPSGTGQGAPGDPNQAA